MVRRPTCNVQPMSCPKSSVDRTVDLPSDPDVVWEELIDGGWLGDDVDLEARPGGPVRVDGDDGLRVGVVEGGTPGERLSFWWSGAGDAAPPSFVEVELEPVDDGTRIRIRETVVDVEGIFSSP